MESEARNSTLGVETNLEFSFKSITGGPIARDRPETVRILLDPQRVYFQAKSGSTWRLIDSQSRRGLDGDPVALRVGKLAENGSWGDHGGPQGAKGTSVYRNLRVLGE